MLKKANTIAKKNNLISYKKHEVFSFFSKKKLLYRYSNDKKPNTLLAPINNISKKLDILLKKLKLKLVIGEK